MTGQVHSFETLGAVDGPGVRVVVFLAGCPLRCVYCHNPDTRDPGGGTEMTPAEVVRRAERYRPYFGQHGGVTFSGGEPLMQAEFVLEAIQLLQRAGISAAIDTSGGIWNDAVRGAVDAASLVILDIKHTDPEVYQRITGRNMDAFSQFYSHCVQTQKRLWARQVIVPGVNDTEENVRELKRFLHGANVERTELLGYHTLGVHKWEKLGLPYPLAGTEPASEQLMERLNRVLKDV